MGRVTVALSRFPQSSVHKENDMSNKQTSLVCFTLTLALFFCYEVTAAGAMQQAPNSSGAADNRTTEPNAPATRPADKRESTTQPVTVEDRLKALEQVIERQQREIRVLRELVEKRGAADSPATVSESAATVGGSPQTPAAGKNEAAPQDATQKKIDDLYKRFGAIRFSGDIRFRAETFHNQGFDNPVDSPGRNRLRVRARLALDGAINKNFDWGFRLATGIFTDPITTNQTLTDFFERKTFALERAFVRYDSKTDDVGVQLVAGKFGSATRCTRRLVQKRRGCKK